jgi:hypothetical protein
MKHVPNFKTFAINEATKITTTQEVTVSKALERTIKEALKLSTSIAEERAKFEETMKIKELALKAKEDKVTEAMKELGATTIQVGKVLAKMETSKGRVTHSYAQLWQFALEQVNEKQKKAFMQYQELNKKINPDKMKLAITKTNEGKLNENIYEIVAKAVDYLKKKTVEILSFLTGFKHSVNALDTLVNAGIKDAA